MKEKKVKLVRVSMNLPENLVDKVKDYAQETGLNVTSAYTVLLNQALDQKNLMQQMPVLIAAMDAVKTTMLNGNDNID